VPKIFFRLFSLSGRLFLFDDILSGCSGAFQNSWLQPVWAFNLGIDSEEMGSVSSSVGKTGITENPLILNNQGSDLRSGWTLKFVLPWYQIVAKA